MIKAKTHLLNLDKLQTLNEVTNGKDLLQLKERVTSVILTKRTQQKLMSGLRTLPRHPKLKRLISKLKIKILQGRTNKIFQVAQINHKRSKYSSIFSFLNRVYLLQERMKSTNLYLTFLFKGLTQRTMSGNKS